MSSQAIAAAKVKYQSLVDSLWVNSYSINGVKRVKKFSDVEHERRLLDAERQLERDLADIIDAAQERINQLNGEKPPQAEHPQWLDNEQLTRASSMAPFVREDIEAMTAGEFIEHLETTAESGDRVLAWLSLRAAADRMNHYAESNDKGEPQEGLLEAVQKFPAAVASLRSVILPADVMKKEKAAEKTREAALDLIKQAQRSSPTWVREQAAVFGVNPKFLAEVYESENGQGS